MQHHGVDAGTGELTYQGVQIAAAEGAIGDGMIEGDHEQASVAVTEQASHAETPGERGVVYGHGVCLSNRS
ncbi:hypothetical protein GCM10022419_112320 [Nonomuraea rosea]|uniref:Uncharacterized protein n=1 Tax=Nonomuraea rosea TaxID=638574 RepID=A0ABP6ZLZ8_9ACTN